MLKDNDYKVERKEVCVFATEEVLMLDEKSMDENKKKEALKEKFEGLCKVIKFVLGDKVGKVVVSDRVVDSPCCLVTGEYGWTANMERIMKTRALRFDGIPDNMPSTKIMEINPESYLMEELRKRVDKIQKNWTWVNGYDKLVEDLVLLLFEMSLVMSGFFLESGSTQSLSQKGPLLAEAGTPH